MYQIDSFRPRSASHYGASCGLELSYVDGFAAAMNDNVVLVKPGNHRLLRSGRQHPLHSPVFRSPPPRCADCDPPEFSELTEIAVWPNGIVITAKALHGRCV
jgi:hypothetical protein